MTERSLLLIEVEPQVAGAYELFLSGRGYAVTAVSSVAAALRQVATAVPQAAIIGALADSLDAAAVAERLRAVASPHPLSVVVLSPSIDHVAAADIVIPRGAHPRALLDALRTVLRRRPQTQPLATAS